MPERRRGVCLSSISRRTVRRYSEARALFNIAVQRSVLCRGLPGLCWDLPRSSDATVEGGLSEGTVAYGNTRCVLARILGGAVLDVQLGAEAQLVSQWL